MLVVATPCPLLLAVPIAIVSGISRAAHRGIIVKGGGALETLARAKVLILDKTGTLTSGVPQLSDIETFSDLDPDPGGDLGPDELLRLAASLDQVSPHVLAAALVRAARERGIELVFPTDVHERHGAGIEGVVDGHRVALGKASFVSGGRADASARPRGAQAVHARRLFLHLRRDRRPGGRGVGRSTTRSARTLRA